mgnify:FL=1|jgi:hypothetical protein
MAAQGGGDPISAIANAVSSIYNFYGKALDALTWKKKARYSQIPNYADPLDYQTERTMGLEIFIAGLFLLFIVIGVVVALRR